MWLRLFLKVFFTYKYIKIIFFYFLKINYCFQHSLGSIVLKRGGIKGLKLDLSCGN